MKDFKNGFIMGVCFMVFMAMVISCVASPLEANDSDCGTSWNPCFVKIID